MNSFSSSRLIAANFLFQIFYFPIWWYTFGLFWFARKLWLSFWNYGKSLAIDIWLKNLFVPMYGQYDLAGRIISFLVRLFQVVFRTVLWLAFCLVLFGLFFVWVGAPIFIVWQIIFNLKL